MKAPDYDPERARAHGQQMLANHAERVQREREHVNGAGPEPDSDDWLAWAETYADADGNGVETVEWLQTDNAGTLRERWQPGDDSVPWPAVSPAALHGLAGDVVRAIEPHTEADPVALLVTFLSVFGAAVGRGPHFHVDGADHPARLNVVLVGESAKARKGTSYARIEPLFHIADPGFSRERMLGGFGSGEAVVDALADSESDDGRPVIVDKRLLVQEGEFARLLKTAGRDGSTLSPLLRDAWDGRRLQVRSRSKTAVADGAHVAVLAHVTAEELRRCLDDVELFNGFANRFLFIAVKRSKLLPEGGTLSDSREHELGKRTEAALFAARKISRLAFNTDASVMWGISTPTSPAMSRAECLPPRRHGLRPNACASPSRTPFSTGRGR
ncbi:MAG: hypothetical protein H0W36_07610 [Gemmatimonadetes bacterium]|nr:hypothetical protein [Acidimicrobiia bacterium]MBA3584378.1 hypothetical protein [Gemmatimonadota bacterium]